MTCPAAYRAILAALGLVACSANPDPVPIQGESADIGRLAGEWAGSYESRDSDRHGSIVFQLEAHRDTAFGDVLMVQSEERIDYVANYDDVMIRERRAPLPRVLTIRFVMVSGNRVSGVLEPYEDPTCGCRLRTVFEGRLADDSVAGTYESEHRETGRIERGRWRVDRRP
jgi:hypothetical protein